MSPKASWVAWLAMALLALAWWRHQAVSEGELRAKIRAREVTIAALAGRSHTTDTVYHRDTVRLGARRHATDSTLLAHADTLHPLEPSLPYATVIKLMAGERSACDTVIASCERRVAIRDTAIAQRDTLIADLRKHQRGARLFGIPVGCAAGIAGNQRAVGIGAACGIRF